MNNKQAVDRLMKIYQSEGEKIGRDICDYELLSALDCAFGAFQVLEEAIEKCKELEEQRLPPFISTDEFIYHLKKKEGYKIILEILERYKDDA